MLQTDFSTGNGVISSGKPEISFFLSLDDLIRKQTIGVVFIDKTAA